MTNSVLSSYEWLLHRKPPFPLEPKDCCLPTRYGQLTQSSPFFISSDIFSNMMFPPKDLLHYYTTNSIFRTLSNNKKP